MTSPNQESGAAPPPSPAPPKGPRVWIVVALLAVGAGGAALGALLRPRLTTMHDASATTTAEAGKAGGHDQSTMIAPPAPKADAKQAVQRYTCSMHPWVLQDEPGNCPICGMKLVPVSASGGAGSVEIDPAVSQNIGVRVEPVVKGPIARTVRTVGIVAPDDARVRDISLKVAGWIEKMRVSREGDIVDQGEPLLEIYSPALYAAQGEFLAARQAEASLAADRRTASDLTLDARQQLTLLGMSDAQINALAMQTQAERTTTLRSPFQGEVIAKRANEGAYAQPGETLLRIVDLSRVFVIVAVYERDLPFVRVGQTASLTLPALAGRRFEGVIDLIYPYIDESTRQARVRIAIDNRDRALRPGMFANAEIPSRLEGERILAPRAAVIDTGRRQVAFVQTEPGRFEPRDVRIGVESETGLIEVRSGLTPGEMVVTSGQFLIDSESRLREALRAMTDAGPEPHSKHAPAGQSP